MRSQQRRQNFFELRTALIGLADPGHPEGRTTVSSWRHVMIALGIILLIIGFVTGISILWTIGVILLVVGAILWIMGSMGHAVAGRRHYW